MNMLKRSLRRRRRRGALAAGAAQAQISDNVIKIGVLTDMSGLYADLGGPGSVVAAQDGGRGLRRREAAA